MAASIFFLAFLALTSSQAFAADPSLLQDFCVADYKSKLFVNGFVCKDPSLVVASDFFLSGLDKPGNTNNTQHSSAVLHTAADLPGLNTLGISLARIDIAPGGLNPPHSHPRASEILTVTEGGSVLAAFVTADPGNKLYGKILNKGDAFVFPQGLIHFQYNMGDTNAVALAALSSQNPGRVTIADAVFGSSPDISDAVLKEAFQVDDKTVKLLRAQFK